MPLDDYLNFLEKIDIAIFNHRYQQAMGNAITLLGLGKKLYIRTDITPWALFQSLGVEVYDVKKIDLMPMDQTIGLRNKSVIKKHFSEKNLIAQLSRIFEG